MAANDITDVVAHFEFGTRRWAALTGAHPLYGPTVPQTDLAVPMTTKDAA